MPIIKNTANQFSRVDYKGNNFQVFHAERVPDGFLKSNYELRKDKNLTWRNDKEMRLVGRVPLLTWIKWQKEHPELSDSDPAYRDKFLWKLLGKEENEHWRTVPNRI